MATDLFEFWRAIGDGDFVHPADRTALAYPPPRMDLTGLPGTFMGPLRTAPVVLLVAVPATWNPADSLGARAQVVRDWHRRTREGHEPLPDHQYAPETFAWWSRVTSPFGPWQTVRSKIATVNLAPYHATSPRKRYSDKVIRSLPSAKVTHQWVSEVLFAEARNMKRVVVCLRAHKLWGLERGRIYDGWLYSPSAGPGAAMYNTQPRDRELREKVVRTVREVIGAN